MHGTLLLDAADAVIRPAIIWNDGRAVAECRELEAAVPGLPGIAGVLAMPGFTAPKVLWLSSTSRKPSHGQGASSSPRTTSG